MGIASSNSLLARYPRRLRTGSAGHSAHIGCRGGVGVGPGGLSSVLPSFVLGAHVDALTPGGKKSLRRGVGRSSAGIPRTWGISGSSVAFSPSENLRVRPLTGIKWLSAFSSSGPPPRVEYNLTLPMLTDNVRIVKGITFKATSRQPETPDTQTTYLPPISPPVHQQHTSPRNDPLQITFQNKTLRSRG